MPEKHLTTVAYAAGASLAAITLVYIFGPTYFIDGGEGSSSETSRRSKAVGLSNPSNICFINSVLQALAGLRDLRKYLILEISTRDNDEHSIYTTLVDDPQHKGLPDYKIESLQTGMVTRGLKVMLDTLNERPIYKKTANASLFIAVLENAFNTTVSRSQQDAQEFLQIVLERLCDECHAGQRARDFAKMNVGNQNIEIEQRTRVTDDVSRSVSVENHATDNADSQLNVCPQPQPESLATFSKSERRPTTADSFPMDGLSESQIECLTCGFKPKPTKSPFCSLTLNVPQVSSTSLSACFDQLFKTEYIEEFKCAKCRLIYALQTIQQELSRSNSDKFKESTRLDIQKMEYALARDPEMDLLNVKLPDTKLAPRQKIAKYSRIIKFPKIMAIHLSRSVFDPSITAVKNSAKVAFPERLPLGGLLDQKMYRLSSVVCHKGSHNSGHYESFRRQMVVTAPYSTPNSLRSVEDVGLPSTISSAATDVHEQTRLRRGFSLTTPEISSPASASSSSPSLSTVHSSISRNPIQSQLVSSPVSASTGTDTRVPAQISVTTRKNSDASSIRSLARSARSLVTAKAPDAAQSTMPASGETLEVNTAERKGSTISSRRKRRPENRWWRISDDKIKESKTSDVLSMRREVYLLFYELESGDP